MKKILSLGASLLLGLTVPATAHAYLDAGSASMILQLLLGGIAGLVVLARLYWRRLLVALNLREPEPDEQVERESAPPR